MKVARELRKARRGKVIDLSIVREAREAARTLQGPSDEELREGLPPDHAAWMRAYLVLAPLCNMLSQTKSLRKLGERVAAADEEYMPGGPPTSPILDSAFMNWWMADLKVGPRGETVLSIVADLGPSLGLPRELCRCARTMAASRMGVYRLRELGPDRVQLDELVTKHSVQARLPADLKSRGALWLTRLLPPFTPESSDWVVWTTPYLLEDPDALREWLAYCERVMASAKPEAREQQLVKHFKAGDDAYRWLEYITDGYAGVTATGGIALSGVPDRPETLPHHAEYRSEDEGSAPVDVTPLQRVRRRLLEIGARYPFEPQPDDSEIRDMLDAPPEPLNPDMAKFLGMAYSMYGQLDGRGRSPLDVLREDASELARDEQQVAIDLAAGWFSVFEVLHVRVDEGMELRDLLRRRKLWVHERSATRGVNLGDVLAGWVIQSEDRVTLEGALAHVPAPLADAFVDEMRALRDGLKARFPKLGWKKRAGLLAPYAMPLHDKLFLEAPAPALHNQDGHPLLFSAARYAVRDRDAVTRVLDERCEADGDGAYRYTRDGWLVAQLRLDDATLTVECNSRERLQEIKALLASTCGDALEHQLDSHEEPRARPGAAPGGVSPSEMPEEVQAQIQSMLVEQVRKNLDQANPMFGGKTLREVARTRRGREDARHFLVRQQEMFASGGLSVDLGEIWDELGLQPPG